MKKITTLILILITTTLFAQTTNIPDPNFEQALIDLGYDSGTIDGSVPTANISGVTYLNIPSKNIADLTGIEDFASLNVLVCNFNQLTRLNVSNNVALTQLYCVDNSIDKLDLSYNTGLSILSCAGNQLTELNVKNGNNTNISDNLFYANNNPNLTCIEVDDAAWSTANWTHIDATASFSDTPCNPQTYVPDDNFEQALIDLGYDTVLDDYVSTPNISGITNLDISYKIIADLTGIEDFAALTELKCFNNLLTNLDLTNNTALTRLECYTNLLTSLDLSQNTSLYYLSCSNNNLTSLDVSNNTLISYLHCQNNQIVNLDLSQIGTLTDLKCSNNALTSLNVKNGNNSNITNSNFNATNNPNLTCIIVDDATWSTANWTNIDATASFSDTSCDPQTYVPDDNFEQALIYLGYDTVLDDYVSTPNISGVISLNIPSKNIADLTGIEDFAALTELKCYNNILTSLDLTNNTALTVLSCYSNLLTSLDLSQNTSLYYLSCSNNNLTSLDVSNNTLISYLHCQDNQIVNLDLSQIGTLTNLKCSNNALTSLNVKNGNNTNIPNTKFKTTNNPNLTCIIVDDATWSTIHWTNIDATSTFVNDQAACDALSVADNTFETQLSLYPNPVKDSFNIQNKSNYSIDNLSIYSLVGKLVLKTSNTNAPIDISQLKNGVYLVKLSSDNRTAIQKIIINK